MKNRFSTHAIYLLSYALCLCAMLVALACVSKPTLHLFLCSHHTPALDTFFRLYTRLAEWPLYVLMLLISVHPLLHFRNRNQTSEDNTLTINKTLRKSSAYIFYTFACSEILSTLLVQTLKFCTNMPRPLTYFEQIGQSDILPIVSGVHMHAWHSFPSGHTATFFVFATACIYLSAHHTTNPSTHQPIKLHINTSSCRQTTHHFAVRQTITQLCCLIFALLGGYSRIYLSQHFLLDVAVGSLIGVTSATIVHYLLTRCRQCADDSITSP